MMHAPIFDQVIQERLDRKPFQPFAIEFDDGRRFVVSERKALMSPGAGRTIYWHDDGKLDFVDCEVVKGLTEITAATAT